MYYFEVEFSDSGNENTANWICIRGVREPSVAEAAFFCKEDLDLYGFPVYRVDPIDEATARDCYDFSNEKSWPVFGL